MDRERIDNVLLAQLTDTHVLDSDETQFIDNNAMVAMAVESLNAESPRPDAVLGTGDLTNWGRPGQYQQLAALLDPLEIPFLPMAGNHDDRKLLKQTFPDAPWADAEHASWITDVEGVTIVGLDSTVPNAHGAGFDDERAAWLREALGSATGQVILALHHPPFETGVPWMDKLGFVGLDELRAVIADHASTITRILCGHFHRPLVATVSGVTASVGLSVVHHVGLDLSADSTPSVILDPRGYQLHRVTGSDVVTHTRYIDQDAEAFQPDWDLS